MKKTILFKTMLLLCALIVGSSSAWAEEETIATATFNGKDGVYTEGWTTTGSGVSRTDCVIIGAGENITSPAFDLSIYSKVTITFRARRYGTLSGSKATVDVAIAGVSQGTIDITKSSVGDVDGSIEFEPTASMTAAQMVFTCTNATSAGSSHGAGIGTITIVGEKLTDSSAPTATLSTISLDFGNVTIGETKNLTFTVTPANLTDNLTITCDNNKYEVTPTTIASTVSEETTITVTSKPTTANDNMDGTITISGGGLKANKTVTLKTNPQKKDPELTVLDDFKMEVTTTTALEDLYVTTDAYDGEVTITSDNETVIKVEDGLLKALSKGFAVITVSVAATDTYKDASANFTVEVTVEKGVEPEGKGAGSSYYFVKVTSTKDITDGDYLIVYEGVTSKYAFDGSLSTLDAVNNGISVTINDDNTIAATEKLKSAVFTIDVANGTLKSASEKYIGVSSYANGLSQSEDPEAYSNSFAIDEDGNAVISIEIDGKTMTLRYNKASNQNRFRYYKSGQEPIQLYKYVEVAGENTFDIAVSAAGWRGLVTAVDATLPETLTAYTVTAYNESTATLTKVDAVKANTPYIVKGNKGTYTLTVAEEEVEAPENNLLQISTQNTGNGIYVLYNGASGVGFYLWSGGSLGAGRVYLPATTNAREFIGLDSETTGISTVNSEAKSLFNGEFFNMAGQRVAKPAKGLYIVNGKKVVIK